MVVSAIRVVTVKNVVHAAMYLVVVLAGVAAQYILLASEFIAAAQVLVYIGAIAVLILFAVMLTQAKNAPTRLVFQTQAIPAAIAAVVLAVLIALAVTVTDWGDVAGPIVTDTEALAKLLFDQYVLPFEIVGVLLLAAVVGGVFLAKREDRDA
jgi:NADH-quinone oxidoreductase subunit J